jgi:hypothetical protein
MTQRRLGAVITASMVAATLISGCTISSKTTFSPPATPKGFGTTTTTSASATASAPSSTETTEAAPTTTLDTSQCVEVTGANSDLLSASDKDAARKAADTLETYSPPAAVKEAIEHFVSTGGIHFDDPDFTKYNAALSDWVKAVCPT